MIESTLSKQVLTIGCQCRKPSGGIAMVLHTYHNKVFEQFRFVANSCDGSLLKKIAIVLLAYVKCEWLYLTDKNIKIVHIHTSSYNSFKRSACYISQAKRHKRLVVCHVHSGAFKKYRQSDPKFVDDVLHKCDAVVALSASWKRFFADELGLTNVSVINNVVDYPKFSARQKSDGRFHLLFLGLISADKGVFDLLECIAKHCDEWQEKLMLHVAGNGETELLKQKIKDLRITDMVKFEGWVSGDRKAELLSRADAYILPSHYEGLPISILEAMSYGISILATPVGGIPDIVEDGKNGLLFPPADMSLMAASINRLLHDSKLCQTMAECNRRTAADFMPDAVAGNLEKLYKSLLK